MMASGCRLGPGRMTAPMPTDIQLSTHADRGYTELKVTGSLSNYSGFLT